MDSHRLSAEEVDLLMVDRISDAIRPVLIPLEERDYAVQAENSVILAEIAAMVWEAYTRRVKGE